MLALRNPLPKQLKDEKLISDFIHKLKLVPYAGNSAYSSHRFLNFLYDLYELSPSQSAVISDLKYYCFEGDLDVVKRTKAGLKLKQESIKDDAKKIAFVEELEEIGLDLMDVKRLTDQLFISYKVTGNHFLLYDEIKVGGTKRLNLQFIHPKNFMYRYDEEMGALKIGVVAQEFTPQYFKEKGDKVRYIPVYPNKLVKDDGTITTIIHQGNVSGDDWLYARPDSIGSLLYQFSEFHQANFTQKVSGTELVSKGIVMAEKPKAGIKQLSLFEQNIKTKERSIALQELASNKGLDPKVLAWMEYPNGNKPPQLVKFDINRDTNFYQITSETAADKIFGAHRWSRVLSGSKQPKSNIGGNIFLDEFKVRNVSTVKPFQTMFKNYWAKVFKMAAEFSGSPLLKECTIQFDSTIQGLIEELQIGRGDQDAIEKALEKRKENDNNPIDQGGSSDADRG